MQFKILYFQAQMVRRVKAYLKSMKVITNEEELHKMSMECEPPLGGLPPPPPVNTVSTSAPVLLVMEHPYCIHLLACSTLTLENIRRCESETLVLPPQLQVALLQHLRITQITMTSGTVLAQLRTNLVRKNISNFRL